MNNLLALTIREWKAFWYSSVAYIVGAVFLLLEGFGFWFLMSVLNDPRVDPTLTMSALFFGTIWYWFSILTMAPLLTMRTFSEEKRTGTIEVLMSAPVTDWQVVTAKFLGAWLSFCALWGATFPLFLLLRRFTPIDWGPVFCGYLGTALLGAVFIAIGVLASSLTRNQVVAGFVAFVFIILLFSLGLLGVFVQDPDAGKMVHYFSILDHVRDFSRGILDTRPVVLYASLIAALLLLTMRTIGNPKWRA